jgi:hypothetical protein
VWAQGKQTGKRAGLIGLWCILVEIHLVLGLGLGCGRLKVYSSEFGVLLCFIRASGVGEAKAEADVEVGAAMAPSKRMQSDATTTGRV